MHTSCCLCWILIYYISNEAWSIKCIWVRLNTIYLNTCTQCKLLELMAHTKCKSDKTCIFCLICLNWSDSPLSQQHCVTAMRDLISAHQSNLTKKNNITNWFCILYIGSGSIKLDWSVKCSHVSHELTTALATQWSCRSNLFCMKAIINACSGKQKHTFLGLSFHVREQWVNF